MCLSKVDERQCVECMLGALQQGFASSNDALMYDPFRVPCMSGHTSCLFRGRPQAVHYNTLETSGITFGHAAVHSPAVPHSK